MKLLIIDDDKQLTQTLKKELENNFIIDLAWSGEQGEFQAESNGYDLIILDLILPDINGSLLCKQLRKNKVHTPILMLTGQFDLKNKVEALDSGADDYLVKPFAIEELKARIRALLRRPLKAETKNYSIADLTIDTEKRTVSRGQQLISLRKKEFYLLEYMVRNAGRVITREMILDHVWENDKELVTNAIDVHIKYLRDQVDRPFDKKLIKTVHGLGYKIEA